MQGQVLFITGNTGIAEAAARLAAGRGAQVFVCGLDPEPGDLLHMELDCGHYAGDLTETEHAEKAVAHCLQKYGHIDGLFNVAGASGRKHGDGPLHLVSEHGWEWTLAANLRTTFLVTRTVLRRMIPRRAGSIVNMASILASSPEAGDFATHAYAAAKGGVVALTRSMAATYVEHNIRVNAVAPGLVRTPMSRRAQENDEIVEKMRQKQPLAQGLMEPEDVARAALFLLSPESSMITGQVLGVDAGWSLR
ncbi:MAG: SDR family oxidoreductase [Bryobacteraceae bacterium]|nr:SDR family oxidoreductase [Bryobacteraceae bacterium]